MDRENMLCEWVNKANIEHRVGKWIDKAGKWRKRRGEKIERENGVRSWARKKRKSKSWKEKNRVRM